MVARMSKRIKKGLALAVLPLVLSGSVWAAPPSVAGTVNSGAIVGNLDQNRKPLPEANKAKVEVEVEVDKTKLPDIKVMIKEIEFIGQDLYTPAQLAKFTVGKVGREISFADLQEITGDVTEYLRNEGYITAIAYLPQQDIIDGKVQIMVMIGRYGDITYNNKSELLTSRAVGLAHEITKGAHIRRDKIDRTLLIINEVSGVRARAILSPGKESGTAATTFEMYTTEHGRAMVFADNYGSRYTGRNRYGARVQYNNISHVGDQLQVGYIFTSQHLNNFDVRYELPVGNKGNFSGFAISKMHYELGQQYQGTGSYGSAFTWEIFSKTPLKRTLLNNQYFKISYQHRNLKDHMDVFNYASRKTARAITVSLEGDDRTYRAASAYKLRHSFGLLGMKTPDAVAGDANGTAGNYQKTELEIFNSNRISHNATLHTNIGVQFPWKNLDSSEKLYIGGYNAVRAYPQGESGGDMGYIASAEVRWNTKNPKLQLAAFLDHGWVKYVYDNKFGGKNSRTLTGCGVGIIWADAGRDYARLDYALPLSDSYSENDGKKVSGRLWLQFVHKI